MRYREIGKEMSSLFFRLSVLCLFEARVPEFDKVPLLPDSCGLYTEHCIKFWGSSFKLAEYIKPKIQRRHLFADLAIPHLCSSHSVVRGRGISRCHLGEKLEKGNEDQEKI